MSRRSFYVDSAFFSIELSGVLNKSAAGREREADEKFANKIGSQREKCFSRIFSFKLIEEFYFFFVFFEASAQKLFPAFNILINIRESGREIQFSSKLRTSCGAQNDLLLAV